MTHRRFRAVLFDAGGILVLPDPTVLGPLLAYYGGTTDVATHIRAHYAAMAAKSRAASPERDWSAYNLEYVERVGVPLEAQLKAAATLGRTRNAWIWRWAITDSVETLHTLHKRDVPIGVVSNASGQIEEVLHDSAVCQVGDGPGVPVRVIVDSDVVGVAKPDPAIFDFAVPYFEGIAPSEIAYVGDSVSMDVGVARAAGIHPILLDPFDDHAGADFERVKRLSDLL